MINHDHKEQRFTNNIDFSECFQCTILKLEKELSQRKGWQKCQTHGEINADHAWGCPECVRELRNENRKLREQIGRMECDDNV